MIAEILGIGRDNARTAQEIGRILDLDPRSVTAQVSKERLAGSPICSICRGEHRGYFLPANRQELEHFCNRLEHRAGRIMRTREACVTKLDSLEVLQR